ncbi:DUF2996 domain-containing protein [Trichothermofontia sp.]
MADETTPAADQPAAKAAKKPKPEDKPFADFIQQDFLPALKTALAQQGIPDVTLTFEQRPLPVVGTPCWQVIGTWMGNQRQFNLAFVDGAISGRKQFACADYGTEPSLLESFLIDERRITLDLLVFGVIQRLNAQKWLVRN